MLEVLLIPGSSPLEGGAVVLYFTAGSTIMPCELVSALAAYLPGMDSIALRIA